MRNRYRMYVRGKHSGGQVYWIEDNTTGKRESLRTKDEKEASRLLDQRNQPYQSAGFHQLMARTHLLVSDPQNVTRTWQIVMDAIIGQKTGSTKIRWERAAKCKAFDRIRDLIVSNTKAEDFLAVLNAGRVSANVYLRRLHNYAIAANWLLAPVISKAIWPKVEHKEKRAITLAEHRLIIAREKNPERRNFYELCWHLGGAQSDIANLTAENIDWKNRTFRFYRKKTGELSEITFGEEIEKILQTVPTSGKLFPYLATVRECDRATEFKQRCNSVGIRDVTLHCYRYAWAERAKACGFPERFAQVALGHGSKAVARAYARKGDVKLPSLESYESAMKEKIVSLPKPDSKAA